MGRNAGACEWTSEHSSPRSPQLVRPSPCMDRSTTVRPPSRPTVRTTDGGKGGGSNSCLFSGEVDPLSNPQGAQKDILVQRKQFLEMLSPASQVGPRAGAEAQSAGTCADSVRGLRRALWPGSWIHW